MSDVLFRYLLTARERERSTLRRLFLADDPLLEAGVEELVETAVARVEVTSQHEEVRMESVTVPASRRRSVRFYETAQPNPPREGHFERRTDKFPLSGTLSVYTCTTCGGSGKITCGRCLGSGRARCASCGGSGRRKDAEGRSSWCGSGGGGGGRTCGSGGGSGKVTCGACRGEGRLASWDAEVYIWSIEKRAHDELPSPAEESRVKKAFHRWLETAKTAQEHVGELVASFEPAAVADHLGFETAEARSVATRADRHRRRLEDEARTARGRYLFHRTDRRIAPVGYVIVRLAGRARLYWLVGRGAQAEEVTPRGRPDGVKCLGWLGFGSGSATAYESVAVAWEQTVPLVEALVQAPSLSLAGGAAASWTLTLIGAHRVRSRKPPVPAVGLITTDGRPTTFLTCLAYLGSYVGHLEVLDRAYDFQSRRLLGGAGSHRQSESLGIELADGRRIRLVEVANPHGLSAELLTLMARALDAVLILEQPDQTAADLSARIGAVEPAPRIGTLAIDDRQELGDAGASLSLEAIRRAFVEDLGRDVEWQALLERMWRPLDDLLEAPATSS